MGTLAIRKYTPADEEPVWHILKEIIDEGDSLCYSPDISMQEMLNYWCDPKYETYVATLDGRIVGTFCIRNNQPGRGSHIANAGYAVARKASGQGIGYAIGEFSLEAAKRLGYRAMQFNIVVKTNTSAVRLWQKLGFKIIGEIPDAFRHERLGFTNAFIMHRSL